MELKQILPMQFGRIALAALFCTALGIAGCGGGGGGDSSLSSGSLGENTGGDNTAGNDSTDTNDDDDTVTTTGIRIGNGTGASFQEGALGAEETSLPAGGSTTLIVNFVDGDGEAITSAVDVSFTSDCFANGISTFSATSITTNTSGFGTVQYTANGCSGTDVVTASATVDNENLGASVTLSIEADTVLAVEFVSATPEQISLKGLGGTETSQVVFRLTGELGASIIGEQVTFELNTDVGGVTLTSTEGETDNNGEVSTVVQSGTVPTSLEVTATHAGTNNSGTSDSIAVTTGVPVFANFSPSYSPFNPDRAVNTNGIEVQISIIASDYFQQDVPDGRRVFFTSEGGNIDSSCVISSGECSITWRSAEFRPPEGRITVLTYMDGAEDFVDTNGNNVYETTDTAGTDLSEPYVDANEDGEYNVGELFFDTNNNNAFDMGNNLWDGPCLDEVSASADCSGEDSISIWKSFIIYTPTSNLIVNRDTASPVDVTGGPQVVCVTIQEDNDLVSAFGGNPAPNGTTVDFSTDNGQINGPSSFSYDGNETGPLQWCVNVSADDTSDSGVLTLEVETTEGIGYVRTWAVND
ncbi:hypothetical protein [Marinibactrum halimedae]|uniref:Big-1 domain-containing protein n=1 Tax=Marinibactrum halimedae TaxID=1444977 RepID=A0AA37T5D5_9GAMM|nr:hypothetical protein [Marinibactrum halimedae]MCD9460454.1 hypothetical protein [Marinibactrum halimedae]GLS25861.1 hypothetical protein GCM10007877_15750 [Marinibactrum halimedae]